ncbi:MAG: DNA-directed RNA polymerase subunit omega [Coriobacteriia bacterium]|nr:DNA-directed RNA polymerase subunit omega [Coriobacteriia bacterium]
MSVSQPEIDQLLDQVDSKFTLCILSSKRARQINDMIHGVRDQALQAMATSEIAKLTSAKPLSLAMDEIASGDVLPDGLGEANSSVQPADEADEAAQSESPESELFLG